VYGTDHLSTVEETVVIVRVFLDEVGVGVALDDVGIAWLGACVGSARV
jgi:hypothetical protein